jgi:hypothetical protein
VFDEASAVVGVAVEPVAGEAARQPHAPPDDEPLHQVDVEQVADDFRDGQPDEDEHRRPKAVYRNSFCRPFVLEGGLEREYWSLD